MTEAQITTSESGGVCRLTIQGQATIHNAVELKDRLIAELHQRQELELDLSQVCEIDTAGLQVLLLLRRESERLAKKFSTVRPSPSVQNLLGLYGPGVDLHIGEWHGAP